MLFFGFAMMSGDKGRREVLYSSDGDVICE